MNMINVKHQIPYKHFSSLIYYHDKDLVVSLHVLVETVNQFKQNLVFLLRVKKKDFRE